MAVVVVDELVQLRADAEMLGIRVDGRWGADRLREEIAAAQPPPSDEPLEEPSDQPPLEEPLEEPSAQPEPPKLEPVVRAGGYINRGDGRGWILEEQE